MSTKIIKLSDIRQKSDKKLNTFILCALESQNDERFKAFDETTDFCNDLNAMAISEKMFDVDIDDSQSPRYTYAGYLYDVTVPARIQPCRATARQRSEAFYLTVKFPRRITVVDDTGTKR